MEKIMNKSRRLFFQVLVLLLIAGTVVAARFLILSGAAEKEETPPVPVRVDIPERRRLEETVSFQGNLKSENQVTVIPKVAGSVTELFADVGDTVKKGTLLARIDSEAYRLDLQRTEAAHSSAASTWERVDRLYAAGSATRQTWEDARAVFTAAEAQAASARLRLDWTDVRSPADGVVLVRHVNPGSLVAPDGNSPLFTVGSLENLEVEVNIPEVWYPEFTNSVPEVRAVPDTFPGMRVEAGIRSVAPFVNPQTRTFTVVCRIYPGTGDVLRPGMLMTFDFVISVFEDTYSLPVSALTAGHGVWGVSPENQAVFRTLESPFVSSGYVVVPDGWAGDRFVVEGQHFLQDGQTVRVLNPAGVTPGNRDDNGTTPGAGS
jgi:RND family efflux transporter MFP subunit